MAGPSRGMLGSAVRRDSARAIYATVLLAIHIYTTRVCIYAPRVEFSVGRARTACVVYTQNDFHAAVIYTYIHRSAAARYDDEKLAEAARAMTNCKFSCARNMSS